MDVYYFDHNGEIAGVEELENDHSLINNPVNPIWSDYYNWKAYSSVVASLYGSVEDNTVSSWYYGGTLSNFLLQFQLPPSGVLEFPYIFASPLLTMYNTDVPKYTNARLLLPQGFPFNVAIPLVIHSITPALSQIGLNVAIDKASPQRQGAVTTFTASAACGTGDYEYYFTFYNPATKSWMVGQPYSANGTWVWNTSGYAPGSYAIKVWARDAGLSNPNYVVNYFNYTILDRVRLVAPILLLLE